MKPPRTQAERILYKFGGARPLARALNQSPDPSHHRHWSVIYRWGWKGYIPSTMWPAILHAARIHGIYLTESDLSPRTQEVA